MKPKHDWFAVDRKGLRNLIEQHGKGRLIAELVQNGLDERVSRIDISLCPEPGAPIAELQVEDDAPEGFRDLSHAFTLFAESYKMKDPEKRGRFNLGEKLVLAMCQEARITTTTGTVTFNADDTRKTSRKCRPVGSLFWARLRMTRDDVVDACSFLHRLLVPSDVIVTLNGARVPSCKPVATFDATLDTEIADEAGVLRRRARKTSITVYEPRDGETAQLYEMGIPVVETGDRWHVSIGQKVPLNLQRDNVPPAYLRAVRTLVIGQLADRLDKQSIGETWIEQATRDPNVAPEAMRRYMDLKYGEKRVAFDPSDPEANARAAASGYTVVPGAAMSGAQWENAKKAEAISPAGRMFPTSKPYGDGGGPPVKRIEQADWTDGQLNVVAYAKFLAHRLLGIECGVTLVHTTNGFGACYGDGQLDLNVMRLGTSWFEHGPSEEVDALLLHEFAHHFESNHLSEEYYKAICRLGAKLKRLALGCPEEFGRFEVKS